MNQLRESPLGAVVTNKVRTASDFSFGPVTENDMRGGINRDFDIDHVPLYLCAEELPNLAAIICPPP